MSGDLDDFDWWDGHDSEDEDQPEEDVTCNRCGKADLFWEKTLSGWRLYEARPHGGIALHRCDYRNHFEDLT